jgi:hypothetical protein
MKGKFQQRKRRGTVKGMPVAGELREAVAVKPARVARASAERVRMPRILRATRQPVKPMSLADAAREIEAGGDGVVVFRDVETAAVSILYRRGNGELTLVETEA